MTKAASKRRPNRKLRTAGLFAGIGGIEHGLAAAGHETAILCELEPAAVAVLRDRFPDVPIHPDIRKPLRLGSDVNLVTAGFPCQDLSQAGRTKGMRGEQSSLVGHVFELLETNETPWVLLENVPFMLHLARGQAMEFVVSQFENLEYKWAYRVIDTRSFGVPQRRERVYFVASKTEDPRKVLFAGNCDRLDLAPTDGKTAYGFYWTEGSRGLGWAVDAVPTLKGGSTIGIPSPPAILLPDGRVVKPDIRDAERLQGFDPDWTVAAESVAKPSSRWKLVGNAVTVNVAYWLGERFSQLDGNTSIDGKPLPKGTPWPRAAWNAGDGRFTSPLSSWPLCVQPQPLAEFLLYEPAPLSEKATAGFLARFKESRLGKPPGFVQALERHLEFMRRNGRIHLAAV